MMVTLIGLDADDTGSFRRHRDGRRRLIEAEFFP